MNVRRLIPATAVAGVSALGLMAVSACTASGAAERTDDGRLQVVASFYPMQYLAERIGRDRVAVTTLTKPGVEPHDLELKPRQTAELNDAGLIISLRGVQPAVDKAIEQAAAPHKVDAADLTELRHFDGSGHDHDGHEGETEAEHAEHADESGHEEHEEHDHGTGGEAADPHLWLDPVKYAEVAEGVGAGFEKADPENAADYRKNTEALVAELTALDAEFEKGLEKASTRTFITTHSAFGYLAARYGLEQEGISGVGPESEPSPARIKELQEIAEKDKVTTVFFETLASDRTARTLADDTGLATDVLDPLEGITDKSRGDDYLQVMRANLAALQKALGAS
ncbi:metal ABC transporter substrate-binding protein [Streptomyces sp. NPDC090026]|uniref:metal ABC transporter substrate-binding protein n=1 Tax=Streptomyces sp. NPDC090026 TaxID=3365923 RepID=UPI003822816A